jgi:hypothetical protein
MVELGVYDTNIPPAGRGRCKGIPIPGLSAGRFFFVQRGGTEPDSGLFQFCLELCAFAQTDQVVSVLIAGDDHLGSERAEASLGTYVGWTHRKYFRSTFQFNTRPSKERELTDLADGH